MASGITKIADVVVPEIFVPYVMQMTEEKARIVQSGILARNPLLDQFLSGGGNTFNLPSWRDLDNDDDNVSSDDETTESTPSKIQTSQEIGVRLSRNKSWSDMDLSAALAGSDPMQAILDKVSFYWLRRQQRAFIATMNGVIADNAANDSADYVNDVSGASFIDGLTNITAEAVNNAALTLGDSMDDLTGMIVHSVVYTRMLNNNLIDFIPDSQNPAAGRIATYLNKFEVIVDDNMPATGNVYDTWLFGAGAAQLGVGTPSVPVEVERFSLRGNGGGQEVLTSRLEWLIHPTGHAYVGTPAVGGPSNAATTNNLAAAGSWNRVYPERKQIKFARLVTREA